MFTKEQAADDSHHANNGDAPVQVQDYRPSLDAVGVRERAQSAQKPKWYKMSNLKHLHQVGSANGAESHPPSGGSLSDSGEGKNSKIIIRSALPRTPTKLDGATEDREAPRKQMEVNTTDSPNTGKRQATFSPPETGVATPDLTKKQKAGDGRTAKTILKPATLQARKPGTPQPKDLTEELITSDKTEESAQGTIQTYSLDPDQTQGQRVASLKKVLAHLFSYIEDLNDSAKQVTRLNGDVRTKITYVTDWADRAKDFADAIDEEALEKETPGRPEPQQPRIPNALLAQEIREELEGDLSEEDQVRLVMKRWPKEAYKKTVMKRKSITNSETKTRVLIGGTIEKENPIHKALGGQFPSLERAEKMEGVTVMKSTDTIINQDGTESSSTRKLVYCSTLEREDATQTKESFAESCIVMAKRIEAEVGEDEQELDVLAPEEGMYMWTKSLEVAFRAREITITLCSRRKHEDNGEKKWQKTRRNEEKQAGILIRSEGRSYAQILRSIEENVSTDDQNISRIERRANGDISISVLGGRNKAEELQKSLGEKIDGVRMGRGNRRALLHVSNLTEECAADDIKAAVHTAIGDEAANVVVTSVRGAYGNTARASIILDEEDAVKLLAIDRVKIGLISTRFRRPPEKCRRCWNPNHTASVCKGPDRSKACFKCHKEGHNISDCKGEPAPRIKFTKNGD